MSNPSRDRDTAFAPRVIEVVPPILRRCAPRGRKSS